MAYYFRKCVGKLSEITTNKTELSSHKIEWAFPNNKLCEWPFGLFAHILLTDVALISKPSLFFGIAHFHPILFNYHFTPQKSQITL